ncbi:MAG TPA: hypothetical protein VLR49_06930 [Ferruginibacter sp.]|nr:hypothetical protein [Ferruginibacter sp.]
MKKIVFACDGNNFPKGAFEFVKDLQKTESLLLTGCFLQSVNFEEMIPGLFATYAGPTAAFMELEKAEYKKTMLLFEELCQHNGIEYRVHEESNNWNMDDLLKETRFADLMIMSEELFCTNINMTEPNSFMQRAIHKSECPVMLFPETYKPFKKLVFAYDGKKESMFALKQFCNLFPRYSHLETNIVYSKPGHVDELPDMMYIEEYASRHFSNLQFEKLLFNGRKYFADWAKEENDILLISGSYGRSGLSTAINKSFVEKLIEEHQVPVFIAHT